MTTNDDEKAAKEYCDKEFQDVYDPWSEKRSFLAGTKHGREAERRRIWDRLREREGIHPGYVEMLREVIFGEGGK